MELILETPKKVTPENIEDLISAEVEEQVEALDEEGFDEWLDEVQPEGVNIGSLNYSASRVLKEVDPIAYRCCMTDDYQESMRESIEEQVRDELEALMED
tara:strand:+ start:581 stop:880 length:300 start_codon:yes stop_codon:yes gene_type:complete